MTWRGRGVACLTAITIAGNAGAESPPRVVLDRWWALSYAGESCIGDDARRQACELLVAQEYEDFQARLVAAIASSHECAGIALEVLDYPAKFEAMPPGDSGSWRLSVNFSSGRSAQFWQLRPPEGRKLSIAQDTGLPEQMAPAICSIVKEAIERQP